MLKGNKLLLALLLPAFVLAFSLVTFASEDDDIIIIEGEHVTLDQWAQKQAENSPVLLNPDYVPATPDPRKSAYIPANDEGNARISEGGELKPWAPHAEKAYPATNLIAADFNDGVFPPTGWTVTTGTGHTSTQLWRQNAGTSGIPVYEGTYGMLIGYDSYNTINCWFTSPAVTLTSGTSWQLDFAWITGYYWMVSPNPNGDVMVKISTDGGSNWTQLWREEDAGVFPNYIDEWSTPGAIQTIPLSAYEGMTVQIAFQYYGYDADGFGLDYISINDGVLPDGRCCYGVTTAPSCADETQAACEARPDYISWTLGMTCASDPCPIGPPNDQCDDAIAITIPSTVSGSTIASTVDCPGLLDWNGVWYSFTLPYACNFLNIDFTPTIQDIYTVGVVIMNDCACDDYLLYDVIDWGAGGDPSITWQYVDGGEWYFPCFVALDDADTPMDFVFDISVSECPSAPPNDLCANAEPLNGPYPQTVAGTTLGATIDCPGLLNWNAVWYTFELNSSTNCSNVTMEYCGTVPDLVTVGVVLFNDCSCGTYILHSSTSWTDCGDGNPSSYWNGLANGTYYYPAFTGPGTYGGQMQDFLLTMDAVECPPANPGDDCTDPIVVTVTPGSFLYTDANYTCGRKNDYSNTCLGSYDGGEDIIYELDVTGDICLKFTMDPLGTTWTGMALDELCPLTSVSTGCIAKYTTSGSTPYYFEVNLTPGTYYLMMDTYPSPNCIPAFNLTIQECPPPQPGDNCSDPLKINLPSDLPYHDDNYTCGRKNDYSNTCMYYYDGGEDILYEVNVDQMGYYQFILDPSGETYSGMGLGAACPPPGTTYTDCIAVAYGSGSTVRGFTVFLMPGTYYLMIDTWPSPACLNSFALDIIWMDPPHFTTDKTLIEFCNVNPGDNGCVTMTLGNDGDVTMNYDIAIQYGLPYSKEILGANIVCLDPGYYPGGSATLHFRVTNASSDAEWIKKVQMDFPAGVTVTGASDIPGSGSYNMIYNGATGDGALVVWDCIGHPSGYGCIYSTSSSDFTVDVTIDPSFAGAMTIPYQLDGDIFGSEPHIVYGNVVINSLDPYYNWLSVSSTSGTILGGATLPIQVCYNSYGIDPGVYFASLVISHNGGVSPITVPVTLNVGPDRAASAVIAIDKSGSMSLLDAFQVSRLDRAKTLAHADADNLLGLGYQVAVMSFNETEGPLLLQDFTTVGADIHDAIDLIVNPRHDTPLAAAMCQAHCELYKLGCGVDAVYTYTDGLENESDQFDMCLICDICYQYLPTGWNYDCNPSNPGTCTQWQLCLADVFADNGVNMVNYFGTPINPFGKGAAVPEDLFFLKYTAETSGGEFRYFADAPFVPGDANGDAGIDVSDAVYIINYVFVGGDAPQPLEAGDANCDANVDVSDAVWIINFVFVGGPAPADCQ